MEDLRLPYLSQLHAYNKMFFAYYIFDLKSMIDGDILSETVNQAILFHPIFRTKLIMKDGLFYLEENLQPAIVKEHDWKYPMMYGNKSNNEFPWIITYFKNRLIFTCAHCLCDGMGAISFLKTVFSLYFKQKGIDNSYIFPSENDICESCKDPYQMSVLESEVQSDHQQAIVHELASVSLEYRDFEGLRPSFHRIEFDEHFIKGLCKEKQTSISALFSAIIAKAYSKALHIESGKMAVRLAVDLRRFYNINTNYEFVMSPFLMCEAENITKCSTAVLAQHFRKELDKYLTPEYRDMEISHNRKGLERLLASPHLLKDEAKDYQQDNSPLKATMVYSHLTKMSFPKEIEDQIDDFTITFMPIQMHTIGLMGSNFKGKISFTLIDDLKDDALIEEFENILQEENIIYQKKTMDYYNAILYNPPLYRKLK